MSYQEQPRNSLMPASERADVTSIRWPHRHCKALRMLGICGLLFLLSPAYADNVGFDAQRQKVSKSIATQPEEQIALLLESGIAEEKFSQAHTVAQGWFLQNRPKDEKTLLLAAKVAENSAHFPAAVAFYQQYLAKADVKSDASQKAVMRLYKLMVDVMRNKSDSAYAYILNNGEGFMRYGSAKQYNTWVLNRALEKHDYDAFLRFLAAVCRSITDKTELQVVYDPYFRKALNPDGRYAGDVRKRNTIEYGKLMVELGKAITHDKELKLLTVWRGEVLNYNAKLHNQVKPIPQPPLDAAAALLDAYPRYGETVWRDFYVRDWHARAALMKKENGRDEKIAFIKKYLPKMPPIVRCQVLQIFIRYAEDVVEGKEKAMLNARKKPKDVKLMTDKDPKAAREKEFRKLIRDFDSREPKLPHVYDRLVAVLGSTPDVWPELMSNPTPERQWLLFRAISEKTKISTTGFRHVVHPHHREPPHWAEPHLRKLVGRFAETKQIIPWLTLAWTNSYKPKWFRHKPYSDPAGVKLMEKLMTLPAYDQLPVKVKWAAASVFRIPSEADVAMAARINPAKVCREVLALTKESDAAAAIAALRTALARIQDAPVRIVPEGSGKILELKEEAYADPDLTPLLFSWIDNPSSPAPIQETRDLFRRIVDLQKGNLNPQLFHRHAAGLWLCATTTRWNRGLQSLTALTQHSLKDTPSLAASLARAGLHVKETVGRGLNEFDTAAFNGILNRANQAMELSVIPVDEADPAYPVYKSQNEFVAGNVESAWKLFEENAETALAMHRKLSAGYMLWVLERLIDQRRTEAQERVVKALQAWRDESASAFTKGQSIRLDILYGDIARQRGMLEEAHKIYRSIQEKKENAGIPEMYTAVLRRIEIERITKNFDAALRTSEDLINMKVPELWAKARYAKAMVYFDMKDFEETKDIVESILQRQPGHADAKILQGKVLLQNKSLKDATEVEIPSTAVEQDQISPGELLKVTLTDPTLAVAGGGTDIEVEVWATSGDRELILLAQFGDSKTKFRGTARVQLGKPNLGDRILQVVGDDKIYYAYSERFRKKVGGIEAKQGGPLSVVSNATLMASARKLLTLAEQKEEDKEILAETFDNDELTLAALSPERRAEIEARLEQEAEKRRIRARVKPGNPIYLRVVDEDRSRTAAIDQLAVSVESSSGDSVGQVVLQETGTHTGTFEAVLPTRGAQAMAFASSTRSGLNPNMVISPKTYPAWRSAPGKQKGNAVFTVDLNDNVAIGKLTIKATEPEMRLKRFRLLTGMNRRNLQPVATWPQSPLPKDPLAPTIFVVQQNKQRHGYGTPGEKHPYKWDELAEYMKRGYVVDNQLMFRTQLEAVSQAFSKKIFEQLPFVKTATHPNHVTHKILASRFRAHFYEPKKITRQFRVVLGKAPKLVITKKEKKGDKTYDVSKGKTLPCFVVVGGRPLAVDGATYQGAVRLSPGLHRFEIFAQGRTGRIGFGRSVKVQTRLSDDEEWTDCPDAMFDPGTFPPTVRERLNQPAEIAQNENGTAWTVNFAKDTRARVLTLELLAHDGPEASLSKLELTNAEGEAVLPVQADYAELTKNKTLEILTGDQVWIRYRDDRFVDTSKEKQERRLVVSFSDAKILFADIEPRMWENEWKPFFESILRFRHDEKLSVVVKDPDMDVSDKQDSVKLTLSTEDGREKNFTATEMPDDPGTFRVFVTPVKGAAKRPHEFQVKAGGTITVKYLDQENVEPGIPWVRINKIRHADYQKPTMLVSSMTAESGIGAGGHIYRTVKGDHPRASMVDLVIGSCRSTWQFHRNYVAADSPESRRLSFLHGRMAIVKIAAPHLLLRPSSKVHIFVQTETGRKMAARQAGAAEASGREKTDFDLTVPGTRMIVGEPNPRVLLPPHGQRAGTFPIYAPAGRNVPTEASPGTFYFPVRLRPGVLVTNGLKPDPDALLQYATAGTRNPLRGRVLKNLLSIIRGKPRHLRGKDYDEKRCRLLDRPVVKPGERLYIGLAYEDESGKRRWLTASGKVITHGQFEVLPEEKDMVPLETASLGDRVRVRVLDLGFDRTDQSDTVTVQLKSEAGYELPFVLTEEGVHSGIFQGSFLLTVAGDEILAKLKAAEDQGDAFSVSQMGFPADYGDTVSVSFQDSAGNRPPAHKISLGIGSDGDVKPFSKRYGDSDIAVQTQFALAEAHLEVARRYEKLQDSRKAKLSYEQAKQLLASTIDRFNDAETRAHAEYLLGNLTYEEASNTSDKDLQEERYQAALARFIKVTTSYPDSSYASKAQFKKALVYELLKEPETAAQEYVKLAYKYPDSEYLAVAMYRLGAHFLIKAKKIKRELAPLQAQIKGRELKDVDKDLLFKMDQLKAKLDQNYVRSGKIFGRLIDLFPTHKLASKAGLRAGQTYYQVKQYERALPHFSKVFNGEGYPGEDRAQALYWAGKCHNNLRQHMAAFSVFTKCTEDFPETKWSGYSLSELSQPRLKSIDQGMTEDKINRGM